jgi:hypothetical protein
VQGQEKHADHGRQYQVDVDQTVRSGGMNTVSQTSTYY